MRTLLLASCLLIAVAACGEPMPSPSAPTSTLATREPSKPAAPAADGAAVKAAALEALTASEASKGACDAEHQTALEKLKGELEAAMKTRAGDDGKPLGMQPVFSRIVALGQSSRAIEVSLSGRSTTEAHVLAYAAKDISIDVLVGSAAATTMRSPFQRSATPQPPAIELTKTGKVELQSDSRQIELSPGQPLKVKMSGQGCALVIGFMKP